MRSGSGALARRITGKWLSLYRDYTDSKGKDDLVGACHRQGLQQREIENLQANRGRA